MIVKKIISICAVLSLVLVLAGCMAAKQENDGEKYSMNASIAYGAAEDDSLDRTKVTYQIVVSGAKEDVERIAAQQVLINADYAGLLLDDGPHQAQMKYDEQLYLEMSGTFVFDTQGKSKEEIDAMHLLQGVSISDKENNTYVLEFQR